MLIIESFIFAVIKIAKITDINKAGKINSPVLFFAHRGTDKSWDSF